MLSCQMNWLTSEMEYIRTKVLQFRAMKQGESSDCSLLAISAKTEPALRELARRYASFITSPDAPALSDICYTANAGRQHHAYRAALLGTQTTQFAQQLLTVAS